MQPTAGPAFSTQRIFNTRPPASAARSSGKPASASHVQLRSRLTPLTSFQQPRRPSAKNTRGTGPARTEPRSSSLLEDLGRLLEISLKRQ